MTLNIISSSMYLRTLNFGKWMAFFMNTVKLTACSKAGSLWGQERRFSAFLSLICDRSVNKSTIPDNSIFLNGTPGFDLTGLECVVVVRDTPSCSLTCSKTNILGFPEVILICIFIQ